LIVGLWNFKNILIPHKKKEEVDDISNFQLKIRKYFGSYSENFNKDGLKE
jgi:hypothetical protein